jgi:hypothetical protein
LCDAISDSWNAKWAHATVFQEPALGSRRLHAGHHSSSQQASLEFYPGPTTGARFR